MFWKKYFSSRLITFVLLFFLFLMGFALWKNQSEFKSPLIGRKIPPLKVLGLNQKPIALQELLGHQKKLLYFWSTSCWQCRKEIAHLKRLVKMDPNLKDLVVSVALLTSLEDFKSLKQEEQEYPFSVFLDPEGLVGIAFGVTKTPEVFFVEQNGVQDHRRGSLLEEKIFSYSQAFLSSSSQAF